MSSIKSTLARLEESISLTEAVGCNSKDFLCNIAKDASPRKSKPTFPSLGFENRINDTIWISNIVILNNEANDEDLTETSCSTDSAPDRLRQDISESSFAEMMVIAKVEPVAQMLSKSTYYESEQEDEDESEDEQQKVSAIENKKKALSDDSDGEKGLMLSWEEQRKLIASRGRKPLQDTGASVSLKDRMQYFNASSSSMGAVTDKHFGETDEPPRVRKAPDMKIEDKNLKSKGEVQSALKESDVGQDNFEDHESKFLSLNAMKPDVETKKEVTSDNGTNTGNRHGRCCRCRRCSQQDTAEEDPPEAKINTEIRKRDSEQNEAPATKVKPVTQIVSTSTKCDSADNNKNDDDDDYEVDQVAVQPQSNEADASGEDDSDGGKGLMLSWEEQRKILMSRGRKPQQDIGTSVSLKDRMRAFNASNSSMRAGAGTTMDSPAALNASSSSLGAAINSNVEESEESSRFSKVPEKESENDELSAKGIVQATVIEPEGTALEEPPKSEFEMEIRKSHAEDRSRNDAPATEVKPVAQMVPTSPKGDSVDNNENDDYYEVDQVAVQPQSNEVEASGEDDSDGGKGLMLSWEEQRKILMSRGRKPQQDIGASVSLKDRMRAFNASIN